MSVKLYFEEFDDEYCFTKAYFINQMKKWNIKEKEVYEAKADRTCGFLFCTEFTEIVEIGDCGNNKCPSYSPRNKISGICKYHSFPKEIGKKVIIKL